MAITIGSSNISSLQAQKSLSDATSKVADAYKQLSSGLRINEASDDAAGLAIASQLNSKARVYNVGARNVNDGISASNIAQGALNALKGISERQLELTEQAANGTYSAKQRSAINTEANALVDEYNRIVSSTTFNGLNLFDPRLGSVLVQAGNSTLKEGFSEALSRAVGDGTFTATSDPFPYDYSTSPSYRHYNSRYYGPEQVNGSSVATGDFNGDGILDVITTSYYDSDALYSGSTTILLGNGDGQFKAPIKSPLVSGRVSSVVVGDFNGDGKQDFITANYFGGSTVSLGNGDGTFKATKTVSTDFSSFVISGDFNGDGILDVATTSVYGDAEVLIGNGDGTFNAVQSLVAGLSLQSASIGDFNGDGKLDLVASTYGVGFGNGTSVVFLGNGNGSFQAGVSVANAADGRSVSVGDFNGDGKADIITANYSGGATLLLGNGDGSFQSARTIATGNFGTSIKIGDFNGDGKLDFISGNSHNNNASVSLGNGDGTFKIAPSVAVAGPANSIAIGDFTGDGRTDLIVSGYVSYGAGRNTQLFIGNGTYSSTTKVLNLNTRQGALDAQTTINGNLSRVEAQLGSLGATGSRFQTALSNLQTQSENFTAAASRIQDADVAQESSVLVRTQILQQAAASVLAQANQQPSLALKLLS